MEKKSENYWNDTPALVVAMKWRRLMWICKRLQQKSGALKQILLFPFRRFTGK